MTSLYDQSVPMMIKYLNNASKILDKTVTFAKDNDKNLDEILTFRLRDDMRPLPYQIQSMSDTAKAFASRVLGHPETHYEDNETTIPELQERITKTIKLLESVDQTAFDAEKVLKNEIIMKTKAGNFRFENGQTYLTEFAIPNFHFHFTTAYCILRHLGVPLGAFDYLDDVFQKV